MAAALVSEASSERRVILSKIDEKPALPFRGAPKARARNPVQEKVPAQLDSEPVAISAVTRVFDPLWRRVRN